jgi:choice-of-anchor B domain-containing protein
MKQLVATVIALAIVSPALAQSTPDSEAMQRGFGRSVAVGGGHVLVGEPLSELASGVVYVFGRQGQQWTEQTRLTSPEATMGDRFGYALAAGDNVLVVTSPRADDETGAAYVYVQSGSSWGQPIRLPIVGASPGDSIGTAVALDGARVAIGSARRGTAAGPVYLFAQSGNGWTQSATVTADAQPGDGFGASLALAGDVLVAGAPGSNGGAGAAYVFRRNGGAWELESTLQPNQSERGLAFGAAVAVRGSAVLVGAPGMNGRTGAVLTYARQADGSWTQTSPLFPFDGSTRTQFGAAIAFDGSDAWVGAPGADGVGRVHIFHRANDAWTGVTKLVAEGVESRDAFAGTLAVSGQLAVVGLLGDDYGAGTAMVFEKRGAQWVSAGKILSEGEAVAAVTGEEVTCQDGVAAMFDCSEVDLVSFLPVSALGGARGVRVNDIWGWTDPETRREYVMVGRTDGTSFVDVSDAAHPRYVGNLPKTESARGSTWRDIKVYDNHAYIVSDGAQNHGMQVFDLTQLRDVGDEPRTFTMTAHYDGIASAHNIVINESTGFAYAVGASSGGTTCGGGLHMIDVREPASPKFAGCFADPSTGRRRTGYSHDAQCVTYHGPDTEHQGKEICLGANETALSIADVSNKENPVALSTASYPNVGYSHQGWLTEDQRFFFMNDELDELGGNVPSTRTLIWDVSDLDDPILVKEHLSENRASDHNLYIRGHLMYQSNYRSGLRVLDISDVENPVEVGYFDTVPYGEDEPGMGGSWSNYPFFESGIVVVTSGNEGIFIVKKSATEIIP